MFQREGSEASKFKLLRMLFSTLLLVAMEGLEVETGTL